MYKFPSTNNMQRPYTSGGRDGTSKKDNGGTSNRSHPLIHLGKKSSRDLEAMAPIKESAEKFEDKGETAKKLLLLDCPPAVLKKRNLIKNVTNAGSGSTVENLDLDTTVRFGAVAETASVPIVVGSSSAGTRRRSSVKRSSILGNGIDSSPRKSVGFADDTGKGSLTEVHEIVNQEDPPVVPKSAFKDLALEASNTNQSLAAQSTGTKVRSLKRLFTPPSLLADFAKQVQSKKVSLESCDVHNGDLTVSGTVCTVSSGNPKNAAVTIRWSTNNWLTFNDLLATFLNRAANGVTNRYSFKIQLPHFLDGGMRLEFAIMLDTAGHSYWDNNGGHNYIVECTLVTASGITAFNKKMSDLSLS